MISLETALAACLTSHSIVWWDEGGVAARSTTAGQGIEARQGVRNNQPNNQIYNTCALTRAADYHRASIESTITIHKHIDTKGRRKLIKLQW
jgi:hypothetical protein